MHIFVYQRQPTSRYAFEKGTATARRVSPFSSLPFTLQLLAARHLGGRGLDRPADGGCLYLAIAYISRGNEPVRGDGAVRQFECARLTIAAEQPFALPEQQREGERADLV